MKPRTGGSVHLCTLCVKSPGAAGDASSWPELSDLEDVLAYGVLQDGIAFQDETERGHFFRPQQPGRRRTKSQSMANGTEGLRLSTTRKRTFRTRIR